MRITPLFVTLIALRLGAAETNWPEFRGPNGDGTSTPTNLLLPLRNNASFYRARWLK